MKGVEAERAIVLKLGFVELRIVGEHAAIAAGAGLSIIVYGQAEEAVLLEVEDGLRQALGGILKVIELPAGDEREGVKLIPLGEAQVAVRVGIDAELGGVEILEKVDVAQEVQICRGVDVIGDEKAVLEGDAVTVRRAGLGGLTRSRDGLYVLRLVDIVGEELTEAAVVLAVAEKEVAADGRAEFRTQVEVGLGDDVAVWSDREAIGALDECTPAGVVTGQELEAGIRRIGKKIREPENGSLADIEVELSRMTRLSG